jgi:hypothetical protein
MTGAPSLAFPGSRKLAGWWRQLASYRPQALWVGHLLLHHVEALVRWSQPHHLDAVSHFLLKALALGTPDSGASRQTLQQLGARLHLDRQMLRQTLRALESEGLAQGGPDGLWTLTTLGRQAVPQREYPRVRHERRTFYFIDHRAEAGGNLHLQFVDLHNSTGNPWPAAEALEFDVRLLQRCLGQSEDWKRKHGFPLEAKEILTLEPESEMQVALSADQPPSWQRVVVDRPQRMLVLLFAASKAGGTSQLMALAIRQDGWLLQTTPPLFTLGADWQEDFPELTVDPGLDAWRLAWRGWCEPRAIPTAESNACHLERQGERLRVLAPHHLVERLRAARSDALKGETWLLAGEGAIRTAALVEVVEMRAK